MTFVECRILPSLVEVWSCRNCQEVTLWAELSETGAW